MIVHHEIKVLESLFDFNFADFWQAANFMLIIGILTLLFSIVQKNKIAIWVQCLLFFSFINSYFFNSLSIASPYPIPILQNLIVLIQICSYLLILGEFLLSKKFTLFSLNEGK